MKKAVSLVIALLLLMGVGSVAEEGVLIQIGDYNEDVISVHQKLAELGLFSLRPESPWSAVSSDALKKLQALNEWEETGVVETQEDLKKILAAEKIVGKNLAVVTSDEWSEWMTPAYNEKNKTFNVTYAELGEKKVGDSYTCQVEIEFKDVTATEGEKFAFNTQGAVDKSWELGNIWNSKIIKLSEPPEDGVFFYTATNQITEKNVDATQFNIGFRCDYWASGSFRIRNIKVEKGTIATEWTPAE